MKCLKEGMDSSDNAKAIVKEAGGGSGPPNFAKACPGLAKLKSAGAEGMQKYCTAGSELAAEPMGNMTDAMEIFMAAQPEEKSTVWIPATIGLLGGMTVVGLAVSKKR